ncbi:DEAD/DEAH box helicase [Rhizobium sp. YJ-22]|uniref:DEAD/DEAH box helicase n=1 Tax=Rhizobium sp. YJ-22 TaxID=3037556 RepID=UPI0024124022|nr:DEAD/DEAH box helicase [Rhizobium sp. YJ-22]MDG3575287.1 DEAD/DEAH box helicase [Rhizobium sp. YJ-22]
MTDIEGIVPAIARALEKRGYTELTPVQKAIVSSELGEQDALVSAQTGSGKTVAFGLALAPTLLRGEERFGPAATPLAMVIAPTRELALQVKRELEWLYEFAGATVVSCVGGMNMSTERRALDRGAHIVVGTPGRLCDHIRRGSLDMDDLRAVVLDEADEMLDLGFREDLEFILEAAPEDRRTLMFSATVPKAIAKLAESYQRNAVRVETTAAKEQHVDIEYRALVMAPSDRENAIINVLRFYEAKNAIVFCSTRAAVNHLTARLGNRGFSVVALSGELSQNERTHALQAMRDGRARVCIATDVAARGIDLPNLELVIHADLPTNPDTLLHRSGRTGRAGRKGVSALIVPMPARRRAERLLQTANIAAAWDRPPSADEVTTRDGERLLADPSLSETVGEDEKAFVAKLLEQCSAEQVAAAFVRLYLAGRSAPEELIEISLDAKRSPRTDRDNPNAGFKGSDEPRRGREDFGASVWFSLSIGRKQNAEPRWLIPMLCRSGNLTKRDIGAIRIQPQETHVELSADSAEAFLGSIGPNRTIEKGIRVAQLDGAPEADNRGERKPYGKPAGGNWDGDRKPPFKGKGKPAFGNRDERRGEKNWAEKSWGDKPKFDKPKFDKPKFDKPKSDKPWAGKPKPDDAAPGVKKAKKKNAKNREE